MISADGQQAAAKAAGSAPLTDDAALADHPGRHRRSPPAPDRRPAARPGARPIAVGGPPGPRSIRGAGRPMSHVTTAPRPSRPADAEPVRQVGRPRLRRPGPGAGILILVVLAGVAVFLIVQAMPAFVAPAAELPGGQSLVAYIAPLVFGTMLSSIIALVVGDAAGASAVALFITHYAPRTARAGARLPGRPARRGAQHRLRSLGRGRARRRPRSACADLAQRVLRLAAVLRRARSRRPGARCSSSGIVLAVMILPIITAVSREVFLQTPEAARGGGARAGRHPLGDDPDGRAAVRPLRHHQRRDARPGPRARRDDGRRDRPVGLRRRHVQPDRLGATRRRSRRTSPCSSRSPPGSR